MLARCSYRNHSNPELLSCLVQPALCYRTNNRSYLGPTPFSSTPISPAQNFAFSGTPNHLPKPNRTTLPAKQFACGAIVTNALANHFRAFRPRSSPHSPRISCLCSRRRDEHDRLPRKQLDSFNLTTSLTHNIPSTTGIHVTLAGTIAKLKARKCCLALGGDHASMHLLVPQCDSSGGDGGRAQQFVNAMHCRRHMKCIASAT